MNFTETAVQGAFLIGIEPIEDARGFLARTWCRRELDALCLKTRMVHCSTSFNNGRACSEARSTSRRHRSGR
jgi:dTDP-4-dehydrorhamnose 3,5-epimerase